MQRQYTQHLLAVEDEDTEQQLSHNSRKRQHKINAQAAKITAGKQKNKRSFQSGKTGGGHDQTGQCHDHEGALENTTGHSIQGSLSLCRQAVTVPAGMWCQWDAGTKQHLLLL